MFKIGCVWYNSVMKKFLRIVLPAFAVLCLTVLGACRGVEEIDSDEERVIKYETYLAAIESNDSFVSESDYFDITGVMNKSSDGGYRYDVLIDHPRIAMYDVRILCVPRDATGTLQTKDLCPSAGILEKESYNLIPYQINKEKGYPAGVAVSGLYEQDAVTLEIIVVWNGYARLAENRQFLELSLKYTEPEPEPAPEPTPES